MRPRFAGGAVDLRPEEIVRLEEDRVVLLDQRRLPDEEVEVDCRSAAEVAEAIRTMVIRGAPAIGVAAAYGYALAASRGDDLDEAAEVLLASRPTAVNLPWAV
jgi:methylthioribose-1-phosphate isomerase